jgi:non-homologous end joining protein Ku
MSGPRKYASDFEIHLGHLTTKGALFPLNKSKPKGKGAGSYSLRGPDLQTVEQVYRDATGAVFTKDVCRKVIESEDGDVEVNQEAVKEAAKGDIQPNHMFLSLYRAEEVGEDVWPARDLTSYVFIPNHDLTSYGQIADALIRKLSTAKTVALAEVNLRGHQNLYRLTAREGYLVLQPMAYVDTLHEFPERKFTVATKTAELFSKLIDKMTAEWDAESYRDGKVDRIRLAETIAIGQADAAELFQPKAEVEPDLVAQLEAALLEMS